MLWVSLHTEPGSGGHCPTTFLYQFDELSSCETDFFFILESAFAESGDEEEADNIMNQVSFFRYNYNIHFPYHCFIWLFKVLDEIGIEAIGSMSRAPAAASANPGESDQVTDDEIERQLKALGLWT